MTRRTRDFDASMVPVMIALMRSGGMMAHWREAMSESQKTPPHNSSFASSLTKLQTKSPTTKPMATPTSLHRQSRRPASRRARDDGLGMEQRSPHERPHRSPLRRESRQNLLPSRGGADHCADPHPNNNGDSSARSGRSQDPTPDEECRGGGSRERDPHRYARRHLRHDESRQQQQRRIETTGSDRDVRGPGVGDADESPRCGRNGAGCTGGLSLGSK